MKPLTVVFDSITYKDHDFSVLFAVSDEDRKLEFIRYYDKEHPSLIGNIYAGRVEKHLKGIGVFIGLPYGSKSFIKEKNLKNAVYAKKQSATKDFSEGDIILLQVIRDAIKTKEPEADTTFSIKTDEYVLEYPGEGVSYSKKLTESEKERLKAIKNPYGFHLLIRTAAKNADTGGLSYEIVSSARKLKAAIENGIHTSKPVLLIENSNLLNRIKTAFSYSRSGFYISRIRTSDPLVFKKLMHSEGIEETPTIERQLSGENSTPLELKTDGGIILSFYSDRELSLTDLYRIRKVTEELLQKKVWLKSGSDIVIEQTEALTSIDVNSNRSVKKDALSVNREAAVEVMRQIRLRNISGIILIDFINMRDDKDRKIIRHLVKEEASGDFARVSVFDFTATGLLELTREKIYPTVKQTLTGFKDYGIIHKVDAQ